MINVWGKYGVINSNLKTAQLQFTIIMIMYVTVFCYVCFSVFCIHIVDLLFSVTTKQILVSL